MARRKRIGKPFDLDAMSGLVALDHKWHMLMSHEKKEARQEMSDYLLALDDERSQANGRALRAYHMTTLSKENLEEKARLEKAIAKAEADLDKFCAYSPGTIQKRKRFAGLSGLEFMKEMTLYIGEEQEKVSLMQDDLATILNAKLQAGVDAYNREMDIDTGQPSDTDTQADSVLYLPFARHKDATGKAVGVDLYMGVEAHDKWFVFEKTPHAPLAPEEKVDPVLSSFDLEDLECPVDKHTRVRKVAHLLVKGHGEYPAGKEALVAACEGKIKWGEITSGGVGHDGRLCVDVGSFKQWRKLHVEAEQIPEAEVIAE